MTKQAKNDNLHKAKTAKNDEFYTTKESIETELKHYWDHFRGKIIYCNCDDPYESEFFKYFMIRFNLLGLKGLYATCYEGSQVSQHQLQVFDGDKVKGVPYKIQIFQEDIDKLLEENDDILSQETIQTYIKKHNKAVKLDGDGSFDSQECIELLKEADVITTNPPFSCFSDTTQVMTSNGWKLIKDVDINVDMIMSLNPSNNQIEMVKAIDYLCSPVDGELLHFHTQNMDFCVTANHKMLSYRKSNNGSPILNDMLNAEDIKKTYLLPLSGFSWKGEKKEWFILPSVKQLEQCSRKEIVVPEKKIQMKDWLEFFGFWLADGCYRDHINTYGKRDYTISIKQNVVNEPYVLDLINRIGFTCSISHRDDGNNNYNIYSKQLWMHLQQFGRSKDKYIPREFLNLDRDYLLALYKGYTNGDGSLTAAGTTHFSSVSLQLIENIQELILKIFGRTSQVKKTVRKHSYDDNFGTCYSITINLDAYHKNYAKYRRVDKIPYNGNVYCLTLEKNHVMLVRHNGIIGWCGNCFRDYVNNLEKYDKKYIIWGNNNAITYKEIFPLIKENKMWLGYTANKTCVFKMPPSYEKWDEKLTAKYNDGFKYGKVPSISVFTNLDIPKRHEDLIVWKKYSPEEYPHYDNYDAINVDKVAEIPCDYCESWGLYPEEFEVFDKAQWEEVRREHKEDTELIYVVPAKGTELRQALHEHSEGYKEEIEAELANTIYCSGCMGVPITVLDKYNPEQLEIVKFRKGDDEKDLTYTPYADTLNRQPTITPYFRILVRKIL